MGTRFQRTRPLATSTTDTIYHNLGGVGGKNGDFGKVRDKLRGYSGGIALANVNGGVIHTVKFICNHHAIAAAYAHPFLTGDSTDTAVIDIDFGTRNTLFIDDFQIAEVWLQRQLLHMVFLAIREHDAPFSFLIILC